jgi:hypothetical protein
MISVLVSGQSLGLPENLSPPMPVMPAIVVGRYADVDAALPVCAVRGCRCRATGVRGFYRAPLESLVCQRSGRVPGLITT